MGYEPGNLPHNFKVQHDSKTMVFLSELTSGGWIHCLSKHFQKTCLSFLWINIIFACPFLYALFFVLLCIKQQEVSCTPPVQHGTKTWFKQFRGDSNFQKMKTMVRIKLNWISKIFHLFWLLVIWMIEPLCTVRLDKGISRYLVMAAGVEVVRQKHYIVSYRYRYKWHPKLTKNLFFFQKIISSLWTWTSWITKLAAEPLLCRLPGVWLAAEEKGRCLKHVRRITDIHSEHLKWFASFEIVWIQVVCLKNWRSQYLCWFSVIMIWLYDDTIGFHYLFFG